MTTPKPASDCRKVVVVLVTPYCGRDFPLSGILRFDISVVMVLHDGDLF